jgi:plastocyanin
VWESGTLGFDAVDGGTPDPIAETPKDLAVGKYSYFCRIHPWMRGTFEVVP